ncbi:hypothetical protein FB567DRAFT_585543 [Paraphoma chrysanthemicola]|uniref:J domain-containing protein n=1 Tax=Paraphoma chrysanthemicola TaxID=798071 RepID=A0A8K0QRA3_9PLEO|nr:hypothetical protein FB567DRAFT_585543 [Paraphoma chrysanthemicola]
MTSTRKTTKSPWAMLGITVHATEAEIRSAYKTLALIHHHDKAEGPLQAEATAHFQKLQAAYERCIAELHDRSQRAAIEDHDGNFYWNYNDGQVDTVGYSDSDSAKDDVDWRAEEYQGALAMFEDWRRENIERRNEEDRLQAEVHALEPRLRQHAHVKLANCQSSSLYEGKTGYEDTVDEDACFAEVEMSYEDEKLKLARAPQGPGANTTMPAHMRLAIYKAQIAAIKARQGTRISGTEVKVNKKKLREQQVLRDQVIDELEHEVQTEANQKKKRIERAQAGQRKTIEENCQYHWKALKESDPHQEEPEDYERGSRMASVKEVPDSWDDE